MAVATAAGDRPAGPGRYSWAGGTGTGWFNDPGQAVVAIVMAQTSDFLFNGGIEDFMRLAAGSGA
jgi:CubicO group peptidase (beta-lactamase class C family)